MPQSAWWVSDFFLFVCFLEDLLKEQKQDKNTFFWLANFRKPAEGRQRPGAGNKNIT